MIHNRKRFAQSRPQAETTSYRAPAFWPLLEGRGDYPVPAAYDYCQRLAQSRYENVPVASRFLPPPMRPHIFAIYAFARAANDLADEDCPVEQRLAALDQWDQDLLGAFHGEADHPIFVALRDTIERCDLPITPFQDLMTAFRMDQSISRYPTFQDLRRYCTHSCEPLGRLMLYVFRYTDPQLLCYADEMCTGLQLANFLQDLALDFCGHRGRLYLPLEDLRHFGVSEQELRRGEVYSPYHKGYRDMMRFQVARARSLLERGRPLLDRVGRDLSFELELTWNSGQAVLDKIEAVGYDVFRRRPVLTSADRARLLARSVARRWPRFIGRS